MPLLPPDPYHYRDPQEAVELYARYIRQRERADRIGLIATLIVDVGAIAFMVVIAWALISQQ